MKRISVISILILLLFFLSPAFTASQGLWRTEIAYDALDRIQYVGKARAGTAIGTAGWSIFKLTYDGTSSRITSQRWAGGDSSYKWIWNSRTGYTYS